MRSSDVSSRKNSVVQFNVYIAADDCSYFFFYYYYVTSEKWPKNNECTWRARSRILLVHQVVSVLAFFAFWLWLPVWFVRVSIIIIECAMRTLHTLHIINSSHSSACKWVKCAAKATTAAATRARVNTANTTIKSQKFEEFNENKNKRWSHT